LPQQSKVVRNPPHKGGILQDEGPVGDTSPSQPKQ
jgi:hypothetical protein